MAAPGEALSLRWLLGANSAAVFALNPAAAGAAGAGDASQRIVYISGNVGIIYDASSKTQQLMRGHVSAAAARWAYARLVLPPLSFLALTLCFRSLAAQPAERDRR
jgi:hypothetical protein